MLRLFNNGLQDGRKINYLLCKWNFGPLLRHYLLYHLLRQFLWRLSNHWTSTWPCILHVRSNSSCLRLSPSAFCDSCFWINVPERKAKLDCIFECETVLEGRVDLGHWKLKLEDSFKKGIVSVDLCEWCLGVVIALLEVGNSQTESVWVSWCWVLSIYKVNSRDSILDSIFTF